MARLAEPATFPLAATDASSGATLGGPVESHREVDGDCEHELHQPQTGDDVEQPDEGRLPT
jgi:hypothetical protein